MRLKGKFYKSIARPATLYCSECWAVDKRIEQRMSGVAREDRIRNVYIYIYKKKRRSSVNYGDKMRVNRFRWFGDVMRRENSEALRTVMALNVDGKRERGRPK